MYRVAKNQPIQRASNSNVEEDQVICFREPQARKKGSHELRLVTFMTRSRSGNFSS